jgi:hypothetical protein
LCGCAVVLSEVVFAVPNDGSGEIVNKADVKGRIALVNRGTVRRRHTALTQPSLARLSRKAPRGA